MVFSFDSILTAVGLTEEVLIMIIAVVIAMTIMITLAGKISDFINKPPHPANSRTVLPDSNWFHADCGRATFPRTEGLYLLCRWVLAAGRSAQHEATEEKKPRETSRSANAASAERKNHGRAVAITTCLVRLINLKSSSSLVYR